MYSVEIKVAAEGRSDRLIPLWSQAYLQAVRAAGSSPPLVVVAAPRIAPRAAEQVLRFAADHAPGIAAGVIDLEGLRMFRGQHLEGLDVIAPHAQPSGPPARSRRPDLFSDLNQWMLKVLLAPELPEQLLSAPRDRYRNSSLLAKAADVSVMSAFRFVQQLERDGYLDESLGYLNVVRREHLFRQWQIAAASKSGDVPMRLLVHRDARAWLQKALRDERRACLALFAAADALGFGFVHGIPPYLYIPKINRPNLSMWKNLVPVNEGESPDVILREAPAPQSVFRGVVQANGIPVSDILQVWLDVSNHPSRGQEQADVIRRRVLNRVIKGNSRRG